MVVVGVFVLFCFDLIFKGVAGGVLSLWLCCFTAIPEFTYAFPYQGGVESFPSTFLG